MAFNRNKCGFVGAIMLARLLNFSFNVTKTRLDFLTWSNFRTEHQFDKPVSQTRLQKRTALSSVAVGLVGAIAAPVAVSMIATLVEVVVVV